MQTRAETPASITPQELHRLLRAQEDVLVVDVREPDEHKDWRIPGSVNVPLAEVARGAPLPKNRRLVLYCAHGHRSQTAQRHLRERGIEAPYLLGGMTAWNGVYEHVAMPAGAGGEVVQVHRVGKGCLSYVVVKDGEAAVVDPTIDVHEYVAAAEARGARIVAVLDTHAHADHASGGRALADATGAPYHAPAEVGDRVPHELLAHGGRVRVGGGEIRVLATPGHTPGSVTLLFEDAAFTGDSLFVDSVGRPDLGQDATRNAGVLWRTLHERLLALPPRTLVLPAHRGEDAVPPGTPIAARLGDLPPRVPALGWDESAFVAWVERNQTPKPANFETLRKINLGLEKAEDLEELRELEAGPNRCAVSR